MHRDSVPEKMGMAMQDKEIIGLYFARDERAIEETGKKYGRYLYTVANNILGVHEDSEACVSDTYLRTWNTIPPTVPDVLRLFLAKIARRLAINRYEKNAAKKRGGGETPAIIEELEEIVAGSSDPEAEVMRGELSAAVDTFLRTLPEREAGIFLRRYFYAEPVSEIAKDWDLTVSNTSVILHRVRGKLRSVLEKEGYLA